MHAVKMFQFAVHRLLVFSLLISASPVLAVSAATAQGRVTDPLGAVIPNAQVTVLRNGSVVASARADNDGAFVFSRVEAGRY